MKLKKIAFVGGLIILLTVIMVLVLRSPESQTILINPQNIQIISKDNVSHIKKLDLLKPQGLISFAPQGTIFVTTSGAEINVWDYSKGKSILSLNNVSSIRCLAISPNGNEFVIADGRNISVWNISGEKEAVLTGHFTDVNGVAFSPDGKLLASASFDHTIRIWDLTTKQTVSILEGHTDWVNVVVFSPDGQQLASGSRDGTVRIWDVASKREIKVLNLNQSEPNDLSYGPSGDLLAVAYDDSATRLWSITDGKIIKEFQASPENDYIALTPDGLIMATVSRQTRYGNARLRFWDTVTGDLLSEIPFPNALSLSPLKFTPDGKILAFGIGIGGNDIEFWGVPLSDN